MKSRGFRALIVLALAVVCALVVLVSRQVSAEAVYPVEKAKRTFTEKVMSRVSGFFRGAKASAENVRLRREVASLAVLRDDIDRLEEENARLRSALGYAAKAKGGYTAAVVLSEGGAAAGVRNTVRIDKGRLAGIEKDAVVVVPEGLVGIVTAVSPHTAEVTLITDLMVKVACEIETIGGVCPRGILAGGSDDVLLMKLMTGNSVPAPRSRVITSGLGGVFPRGIDVGTYLGDGEVQPSVDYSRLEDVFIRREK